MKVVLDTNIVVSALVFGGTCGRLVELWKTGAITPLMSRPMLDEYLAVLAHKKFRLSDDEVSFLVHELILPCFQVVRPKHALKVVKADASDDKFFECALSGGAKIIVSGDKEVLAIGKYRSVRVLSVMPFLREVVAPP